MLPRETKPIERGQNKYHEHKLWWSQHYYKTDQGQRKQNSYEQHVCKFARRGSFQHKVIQKYILCTALDNEEIEMVCVECTLKHELPLCRHWNSTQHKIKLPPFSFTFFIKFHLKVSCPMTQEDWDLVAIIFVVMRWFHCPGSQYYRLLLLPAFHVHLYNKNAFLDTKARKK